MSKSELNVLDLFCGCGGLSKGFEEAGFNILIAGFNILIGVDFEQSALNTFNRNHKTAKGIQLDLSKPESFDEIDSILEEHSVDVIIGGPPCQGFSLTGPQSRIFRITWTHLDSKNRRELLTQDIAICSTIPQIRSNWIL